MDIGKKIRIVEEPAPIVAPVFMPVKKAPEKEPVLVPARKK